MTDAHRGHSIILVNDAWVYADTNELVSENPNRECGHCGLSNTPEGHDACLGTLPGVSNACCGHGDVSQAYVQLTEA